ncbi:MAG: glycosyl hydrolase family protein [Bacteroidales bacterium]|jgi:hypothetical protein|nr:glycosyl hydrolase family protein [Bacteroidales bacterium]
MNLLFKRIFGGLAKTEKFEKQEGQLLADYKRYCDIQTSEQLKEYTALFGLVQSAEFKDKKKTLQNRKYKDTEEYRDSRKFEKLNSSWKIKSYYETLDSAELKEYEAFKASSDYTKLGDPKLWQTDERLKRLKTFEKSKAYKNYEGLKGSYLIKEFEELKAKVNTEEFQKNRAWWEDKHRWQKTEEYQKEQRFYELKKTDDIAFYEHTDPKKFEALNKWALTFKDEFEGTALNSQWKHGFFNRAQALKKIYSFPNDKQAYTEGQNVFVNGALSIVTKRQQADTLVWDARKGFLFKQMAFTSGNINTGEAFSQRYGKIQAKMKIDKMADVSHSFWLGTDGMIPHINIFSFNGKKLSVGMCNNANGTIDREIIKGINPENYYIYTLEWNEREIIWKINNVVVKKVTSNVPDKAMHLAATSFIGAQNAGGESILKIDWIRVYARK